MPATQLTANEKEFYRRECVTNENNAVENWKKKYGDRLEAYDAMYKHIPDMQRCIAGIDAQEGLHYIETGGYPTVARPKSMGVQAMSKKSFVNRPKSGSQKVGYGGVGVLSDYMKPPRAADTIYERDYCVRLDEFQPHIRGVNMTKKSVDGPWRRPGAGTMAVIPTKWQFPSGVKQPEGYLVRSELRKLRLEKEEKEKKIKEPSNSEHQPFELERQILHGNPMGKSSSLVPGRSSQDGKLQVACDTSQPSHNLPKTHTMQFVRKQRPTQSRSWAPADNQAPKGWYKSDIGPGKIHLNPGRQSIMNTPQARLNVLKRRLDQRATVLASL